MPNAIPEKPWSHISVDIITKLPLAQGYDAILVVYDRFSKMAHFVVTTEKMMAEGTCQTIQRPYLETAWASRKYYIRQGSTACSRNDEGVEQAIRNPD